MPESSLNRYKNWPKHEILSKTCVPPETPLFIKLEGRRFSAHSAYGNKVGNQGKLGPATFHRKNGVELTQQILEWTRQKKER